MSKKIVTCNNCWQPKSRLNTDVCILEAIVTYMVSEHCDLGLTPERGLEIISRVNTDLFWDDLNRIIDLLAEGYYNNVEDEEKDADI
ncbi:MAG: hypothetical protein ACK4S4_15625 [Pyrinomonadaceae bacterium]